MQQAAPGLKLDLREPKWVKIRDGRPNTYAEELRRQVQLNPNMIVTAIPSDRDQTYAIVKKMLYCGENPVPSQVSECVNIHNTIPYSKLVYCLLSRMLQ